MLAIDDDDEDEDEDELEDLPVRGAEADERCDRQLGISSQRTRPPGQLQVMQLRRGALGTYSSRFTGSSLLQWISWPFGRKLAPPGIATACTCAGCSMK